jgi:uncharacterized protein
MWIRHYWQKKIEENWQKRSILWLSGVRRVGKTVLAQSLPNIEYFDCELPQTRTLFEDPESFLEKLGRKDIVLDEIHRLGNPSQLLKIAADHFPKVRVLATGSSILGASSKFRDTLTGRKTQLWLSPMILADLKDFKMSDINRRLLHGGMPSSFLADKIPERDFQEWMDAFWAKDILELFRLERKYSFQKFVELLLINSGGIFEATTFAAPCEISRSTISNYLAVLESTFVAHVIRPFSTRRSTELVSAPKVYGFDTGFVAYYKGWNRLRTEDLGYLWEHFVLNELLAQLQGGKKLLYWRDKRGHEVDFVLQGRRNIPIAIECKWSAKDFDPASLRAFRYHYQQGDNYVVCSNITRSFNRTYTSLHGEFTVKYVSLPQLIEELDLD